MPDGAAGGGVGADCADAHTAGTVGNTMARGNFTGATPIPRRANARPPRSAPRRSFRPFRPGFLWRCARRGRCGRIWRICCRTRNARNFLQLSRKLRALSARCVGCWELRAAARPRAQTSGRLAGAKVRQGHGGTRRAGVGAGRAARVGLSGSGELRLIYYDIVIFFLTRPRDGTASMRQPAPSTRQSPLPKPLATA